MFHSLCGQYLAVATFVFENGLEVQKCLVECLPPNLSSNPVMHVVDVNTEQPVISFQ